MGVKKIVSLIVAIIIIILIVIITTILINKIGEKANIQDLRTDLLLIQAKAKSYTEKVDLETANLDTEKEEENTKIEEVKEQKLKGTSLEKCDEKIKNAAKKAGVEDITDYYYLSQQDLNDMGISIEIKKDTYYLVKYNFEDTEVVYTKGYKYQNKIYYKLSEMKNIEL